MARKESKRSVQTNGATGEDGAMKQVKSLISNLEKFYWSPEHPSTYVIDGSGIGNIAHHSYGAFNLIWAGYNLKTVQDHREAVIHFAKQAALNQQVIRGETLEDLLTLLSPQEVRTFYENHGSELATFTQLNIRRALNNLGIPAKTC